MRAVKLNLRIPIAICALIWWLAAFGASRVQAATWNKNPVDFTSEATNPSFSSDGATLKDQVAQNGLFMLPIQSVYASGFEQVDANTQVVDPNGNVTFVIPAGSYDSPFRSDNAIFGSGQHWAQLAKFSMVFSLGGGVWIPANSPAVTYTYGAHPGDNTVKRGSDGFVPIGTDTGSELYRSGSEYSTNQINVRDPMYIQINLKAAGYSDKVDTLTVQEQFTLAGGTPWYKTQLGKLDFHIQLTPKVASTLPLPNNVSYQGKEVGTIVIGTGTIPGDTLHYAINKEATLDSPTMQNADGSTVKVLDDKRWVWLVPPKVLNPNDVLHVVEESPLKDASDNAQDTLVDVSKYLTGGDGAQQVKELEDLIKQFLVDGSDPTVLDHIVDTINDINQTVEVAKASDESPLQLTFDNDANFVFAPSYKTQDLHGYTFLQPAATTRKLSLAPDDESISNAKAVTWQVYKHGSADVYSAMDSPVTLSDASTSGVTATANQVAATQINDLDGGVDIVADITLNSGVKILKRVTLQVLALNPEHADSGNLGEDRTVKLTKVPASLKAAQATAQAAGQAMAHFIKYTPNYDATKLKNSATFLPTDAAAFSYSIPNLSYLNAGDIYQLNFEYHGQTYYSNAAQIVITQPQGPTVLAVPDFDFGKAELSQVISVAYTGSAALQAKGGEFTFGAHTGANNKWMITASMTPFVTKDQPNQPIDTVLHTTFTPDDPDLAKAVGFDSTVKSGPIPDTADSVVVFSTTQADVKDFTLSGQMSAALDVLPSASAQTGTYTSTITWAAGTVPDQPAAR
ncbi:hypothetical protein [Lacticaseibacillus jixiensis]|uniref:hypothetical protein n=1 Tax=Lacticaseibacillus jixiensis TaxID=3231926 RepID=UPI0036F341AA